MDLFFFTLSISVFDSLATTQQIIIFILLLTTIKPLRNSISYLVGLSGGYITCGIVGFLALDQLHGFVDKYFPSTMNMTNASYYQTELFGGLLTTFLGLWYYKKKRHAPPGRSQNFVVNKLKSMNAVFAFFLGAFISVSSFPVSVPYILALGKFATAHVSFPITVSYILLYNIGYALPMLIIFAIYLYVRRGYDDMSSALHHKAHVLNVQLTTWALAGVGIFMLIDASCFYVFGHALVKGRYF